MGYTKAKTCMGMHLIFLALHFQAHSEAQFCPMFIDALAHIWSSEFLGVNSVAAPATETNAVSLVSFV